jgi:tRNA(Arg) A34 adenosine deaminase TadA
VVPNEFKANHIAPKDSAAGTPPPLPAGVKQSDPLGSYWRLPVSDLIHLPPDESLECKKVQERHSIFALLLMALVARFWNGNNRGPVGIYPQRKNQRAGGQDDAADSFRYRGDLCFGTKCETPPLPWDRYIGHNIACLAVDGKGEIIDFDFNHNDLFRSSAEHAESRLVRRIFSLGNLMDDWKTGDRVPNKTPAFALKDVTIYTSLESCAQCSGVMSLGRVKQVVYLQNDPGAYRIGYIMFNLAGTEDPPPNGDGSRLAARPISANEIGLPYLQLLNSEYAGFCTKMAEAQARNDPSGAYYLASKGSTPVFVQAITSFLCTDTALEIFEDGAKKFHSLNMPEDARSQPDIWSNHECLEAAKRFFGYADVEGFRGSPHKL